MLIKFKDSDPRAGMVARMDSQRGQQLIDEGAAVAVKDDGKDTEVAAPAPAPEQAPAPSSAPVPAKSTGKAKK